MKFKDAADVWNGRYRNADGFLFGSEPNKWLRQSAQWLPETAEIVCVADGEGRNSTWLAGLGHRVSAFDVSSVAIERLQALAAERGVEVDASLASLDDWQWRPESVDTVVAIFIQFAPPEARRRLFIQIAEAIRPGGLLIIEGYGLRQLKYRTGGPGVAENLYTMATLSEAFSGWQVLASREVDEVVDEGKGHSGQSHLISAVFRKPVSA